MFDFLRRPKQLPREPVVPLPFKTYASSDVDGARHIVIDAEKVDLTNWKVEIIRDGGSSRTHEKFESGMATRMSDGEVSVNPYDSGEMVPAWLVCIDFGHAGAFIGPDGTRYERERGR